jgi:A/G-specific adenine glycosylase
MLQQTTVAAVRKRYFPFLSRFPDVGSLARATEEEVLAAWSGLGYYARARNLRLAARAIVREHEGKIPGSPTELDRLPGFGEYMAAAVASLAFGARVPAAEANVDRVLSRLFALPGSAGSGALRRRVLARAASLLPDRRPGDLAAALMDLGQMICTPRGPACPACPVSSFCAARRLGDPERFPRRRARPAPVAVALAAAVVEQRGRVLLVRRHSSWLDGLWEFPSAEGQSSDEARRRLSKRIEELGLELAPAPPIGRARHAVVNRRLDISVFRAHRARPVAAASGRRGDGSRWFLPGELDTAAVPTLTRKIAAAGLRPG